MRDGYYTTNKQYSCQTAGTEEATPFLSSVQWWIMPTTDFSWLVGTSALIFGGTIKVATS